MHSLFTPIAPHEPPKLRYYQQEAIDACYDFMRANKSKNPCIVLPTGAGKSLTMATIARIPSNAGTVACWCWRTLRSC